MTDYHLKSIAFVGTYPPEKCGIANYTFDLDKSLTDNSNGLNSIIIPVIDLCTQYLSSKCNLIISRNNIMSYIDAANYLMKNNIDIVSIQHEYGIYGGTSGSNILMFMRCLKIPIITTLHTILRTPNPLQRQILEEIAAHSNHLVVLSNYGKTLLEKIYNVNPNKIDVIPHGVPEIGQVDGSFLKRKYGIEGKKLLLTFGLLSSNKNIETVINALPTIIKGFSNIIYVIIGETHPKILIREGELYRNKLIELVHKLNMEEYIMFHNHYISKEELKEWLSIADIFIFVPENIEQIVSGTLAYAIGAGKAIISTPFWYAKEMLKDGGGVLVRSGDQKEISESILHLLKNDEDRIKLGIKAHTLSKEMQWDKVAEKYYNIFKHCHNHNEKTSAIDFEGWFWQKGLSLIKLDHLRRMTDNTGMLQHAIFSIQEYKEGYCSDDNARALIATILIEQIPELMGDDIYNLASQYLAFLRYGLNYDTGRMRNFLSFNRVWLEVNGSECCHGRTLWALGVTLGKSKNSRLREIAIHLFESVLKTILELKDPRSWSFALLGLNDYLKHFPKNMEASYARDILSEKLLRTYQNHASKDWPWFEDSLTYFNARLSQALISTGESIGREDMLAVGIDSLKWLSEIQSSNEGYFNPIGNKGFFPHLGVKATFDQQPIEAYSMICASIEAFRVTDDTKWIKEAYKIFAWFYGFNILGLSLYDSLTGGCCDGLQPDGLNFNQGAESTLSYILSFLELYCFDSIPFKN